jgi:phosphatidylserine decarboxylase
VCCTLDQAITIAFILPQTGRSITAAILLVVLEGKWSQGLMAMAAVGATNVGSIELKFEPELKTNVPIFGKDVQSVVNTCTYGEKGEGLTVKGGDEVRYLVNVLL